MNRPISTLGQGLADIWRNPIGTRCDKSDLSLIGIGQLSGLGNGKFIIGIDDPFEVVGVDVAAVSVMVLLGLTSLLAPAMGLEQGLVDNDHLFDGFSSNAVMSIIAVMIIGAGLDKTGITGSLAAFSLSQSKHTPVPGVSGATARLSSSTTGRVV